MKTELVFKEKVNNDSTHVFNLMVDGREVGLLQIREKPSAGVGVPENMASNIYYEINEKDRGKKYGIEILKLGIEEARKVGFKEVVVCVLENNIPSKKIIEKNGGVFIEKADSPNGVMLKYKISISYAENRVENFVLR